MQAQLNRLPYIFITKSGLLTGCLLMAFFGGPALSQSDDFFYPTRTDWTKSTGKTNFSIFVFNDLNANGEYDLGDRAISNIATGLAQNGTPLSLSRSNINGFANYAASISHENAPLHSAGSYDFEVFAPPGWRITTQNKVQTRELFPVEGSNAGLGMAEMLHPVGLARIRFIRGTYSLPQSGELTLLQNGAVIAQATLAPGEEFIWPVAEGRYALVSGEARREVVVGAYPVDIGSFTAAGNTMPQPRLIDFENMAPSGLQKAPNGYGGLDWFNLNIMASFELDNGVGYINGATSGQNILYTSSGLPAWIGADTPFDFVGVNLTLGWPQAEGEEALFRFYRGDDLVLQDHIGLSAYGPITYQPNISGVTRIDISTQHNWQLVLDDVRIHTQQ